MAALHHLIYQSTAVLPLSAAEINRLLTQSRAHNEVVSITGMLLYDGSRFLQVLEGPQAAVDEVFSRIRQDCRHTEVEVLANGPVSQRQFNNWAMALVKQISGSDVEFDELQPSLLSVQDTALCMLLHDFQQHAGKTRLNQLY